MKKRFISILLLCSLSLVLFSCGESTPKDNSSTSTATSTSKTSTSSASKITKDIDNKNSKTEESSTPTTNSNVSKPESSTSKKEVNEEIRLYVYNAETGDSMYTMKNVTITDGALVSAVVNALKDDSSKKFTALDSSIEVKSAKLEKDKDLLTVDFGGKFLNDMNLGGGVESGMLQSLVNSLGYNFGVSKVCITVNGKGYSSGHISHKADEPFNVDYSNTAFME